MALARTADELGYRRYWLAEHHNMPAVAATNPPVLIAMVAAATERIRVGSGGVMLPNHAPLVVAEQFALLEAAYPGPDRPRHRPGAGHRPGHQLRAAPRCRRESSDEAVDPLPRVRRQRARDDGARRASGCAVAGRTHAAAGDAAARRRCRTIWLLGSSDYSARLAAEKGLPYVFAHHFSGQGTAEALELYRSGFRPSPSYAEPRTFLTVNAVVARDRRGGRAARAARSCWPMVALRTGGPLAPQLLVEEAEKVEVPDGAPRRWSTRCGPLGDRHARGGPRAGAPSSPRRTASTR